MKRKKSARDPRARKPRDPKDGQEIAERSAKPGVGEDELQGTGAMTAGGDA
jgi:hypothetical protein